MDSRKIFYTLLYIRFVELGFGGIIVFIEDQKLFAELLSNKAEALLVEVLSISSIDTSGLTHCRRGDSQRVARATLEPKCLRMVF